MSNRPLYEIAKAIRKDWKRPYFGAVPYIEAMSALNKVSDKYHLDDGETIIRYFLANATQWKGEEARRVKAELKEMLKG